MNWIDNADSYICPVCGEEVSNPANLNFTCPKCGFVAEKDKPIVSKVVSKQRLIDGNELRGIEILLNTEVIQESKEASWLMSQVLHDIDAMPTIDLETLPIVRELREKLERVTEERDAALKQLSDISDCDTCKHTECIPRGGRGKCKWEWNSGADDNP